MILTHVLYGSHALGRPEVNAMRRDETDLTLLTYCVRDLDWRKIVDYIETRLETTLEKRRE